MGTNRSVLTDDKGLPLAVVLSGANTHDVKLPEETLDHIVVLRPEPDEEHPQNLCLDAGYTGSGDTVEQRSALRIFFCTADGSLKVLRSKPL